MAARAVLAGDATAFPKAGDGPVEALRQLRLARTGAMKARTAAANQLHSVCDTAPDPIRAQLRGLTTRRKVALASRVPPRRPAHPDRRRETRAGRRSLAAGPPSTPRSRDLDQAIKTILDTIAAPLLARHGVGYETAGALLCTAGDNPDRLATEASFAALCGTAPVPISTGNSNRRRLNRAGDRNANSALWTIVMVRLRSRHAPTVAYLERRIAAGHSKRDAIRCLKRFLARELYHDIQHITTRTPHHSRSPLDTKRRSSSGRSILAGCVDSVGAG